jgi:glycosyltransferase involved in cell wall biosynthesis
MRVFIGPNEVAGQYRNLAIALRAIGVDCDYYIFNDENLRYGGDLGDSRLPSFVRRLNILRRSKSRIARFPISVAIELISAIFMLRCIFLYDVFLFGFGCSFLRWNMDLPVLKFFKKRIVANLSHGSDMTPPYLDGALLDQTSKMPELDILRDRSIVMKKRIRKFERYADFIIGSPLSSSYYSSGKFVNLFRLGRVSQGFRYAGLEKPTVDAQVGRDATSRKVRILHAPSHAPGKGTAFIEKMVADLIQEGYRIDFIEVVGKSNDAVIEELKSCDLVVDQVYADLPMSGLAAEAACLGKPTLIAGYDLNGLKAITPAECFPPMLVCDPDELYATLKRLLDDPAEIESAGGKAKSFVFDRWGERDVAQRYLELFTRDTLPEAWWHDPKDAIFLHGYGLSKAGGKEVVTRMINSYGVRALGLEHRPDLEAALLNSLRSPD